MSRNLYAAALLVAGVLIVAATGCQSTGGREYSQSTGGGYSGSDGHYGHSH